MMHAKFFKEVHCGVGQALFGVVLVCRKSPEGLSEIYSD